MKEKKKEKKRWEGFQRHVIVGEGGKEEGRKGGGVGLGRGEGTGPPRLGEGGSRAHPRWASQTLQARSR